MKDKCNIIAQQVPENGISGILMTAADICYSGCHKQLCNLTCEVKFKTDNEFINCLKNSWYLPSQDN